MLEGMGYEKWRFEHTFAMGPAQAYAGKWLQTFKDFPPRQKPGSFNLEEVMNSLTKNQTQ
jgi:arylsulfatase